MTGPENNTPNPKPRRDLSSRFAALVGALEPQDEREFLPAALEVIQTPPSPVARVFAAVIVLFFVCAVAWAFIGHVDVLATAQGRVLPAGDIKTIQPLDPGVVRAIRVQDGDHVKAGQVMVELDPTQVGADRDRIARDLVQARLDVARLTGLRGGFAGGGREFVAPRGAPPEGIEEARAAMRAQADLEAARVAALGQQAAEKAAQEAEARAEIDKLNATLPMLAEKERIHRDLTARGYGTTLSYLDAQQQVTAARQELNVQLQRARQAAAARKALERQRDGAGSQFAADVLSDLRKAEERENELSQQLIKAQDKTAQAEIRAPVDGVVEQLAVHTLGGVVTPAQHLMIVVPDSRDLVIEAQLANRDVGFVHAGQAVKVKIETFSFTRYGFLDGRVVSVSRDAVAQAQPPADASGATAANRPAAAPTYVARIALARTSMVVDGETRPIQPGMAVTAEIRTGKRSIIDYLLSPIARKTQESLHER